MNSELLTQGRRLSRVEVQAPQADAIDIYTVGKCGVLSITVQLEKGPLDFIPWALVRCEEEPDTLVNLSRAYEVSLEDKA